MFDLLIARRYWFEEVFEQYFFVIEANFFTLSLFGTQ